MSKRARGAGGVGDLHRESRRDLDDLHVEKFHSRSGSFAVEVALERRAAIDEVRPLQESCSW